jgi:hypothetical protein
MSIKTCEVCKTIYDSRESKRVYGELPNLLNCCSSQCYTKKVFKNEDEKSHSKI